MDLTMTPRFHRRDGDRVPVVFEVDFNQFYGTIEGVFAVRGVEYEIQDVFALTEDSWMVL